MRSATRQNKASTLRRKKQGRTPLLVTDTKTNVRNVDGVGLWSPSKNSSDEWRAEKLQLEEPIVSPPEEFSDKPNNSKP